MSVPLNFVVLKHRSITVLWLLRNLMEQSLHSAHNSQQPYDEMHQGHWLNIKFEFPQTGK